jgi:endonuclease-3
MTIGMTKSEKAIEIIKRLRKVYPDPKTALNYSSAWELLVATILSAQTTDKTVNTVTPALFDRFKTIESFAKASLQDIDSLISKTNFHVNKAKSIKGAAEMIMSKYGGKVPRSMEELIALPGVARKTANVVLGNMFGIAEGIVVDTHVMRLSVKLGLTEQKDPVKIEKDLMEIVPKEDWIDFSHLLINHGRDICTAKPHTCEGCPLGDLCPDKK